LRIRHGNRASVRHHVVIARSADDVWALVGDPARICHWFPGIDSSPVEGALRTVTTGAGIIMPEQLLTVDPLQRRLQYRITTSMIREHLGTIDVLELGPASTLVVYSTDADPATLALVIGGATANALAYLRSLLEDDGSSRAGPRDSWGEAPGATAATREA
jgi:hypothetical protein